MNGLKPAGASFGGLDFLSAVAVGRAAGWRLVHKFARNSSIGTVEEDLWEVGGVLVYPTTGATLSTVSTSANDTAVGSGAQEITINGLNSSLQEISETIALNGLTPVVTVGAFYRVNHVDVTAAGSSAANEGAITISHSGNPISYIDVGDGHDHCSHYTVPAGMRAWLLDAAFWQGKDDASDSSIWHRHATSGVWHRHFHALSYRTPVPVNGLFESEHDGGTSGFSEGDDIRLTGRKDGAAGVDVNIAGRYVLLLKER
jgi:hypothetical protein